MRKPKTFLNVGWLIAALAAGLPGLAGCGSRDGPSAAVSSENAKSRKLHEPSKVTQPREENLGEMVAAVSATKVGPPVELRFALSQRPEVGQVLDLDVAVVPRAPVPDSVSVSFQVTEGLDIVDGAQLEKIDKPVEGTPLRHTVKILPKRDGIFAVTAIVALGSSSQDSSRTFSIPVIAGEGLSEQVAKGP
jgi:hypothetical protein